jgi:hypothetical protein
MRLAIVSPPYVRVCVNGVDVPPLAIVKEKDEIQLHDITNVAFLSLYTPSSIGRISTEKIGSICPVCRQEFEKDDIVYSCVCGSNVHAKDRCDNDNEQTACADMLSKCLDCDNPINLSLESKLSYIPSELTNEKNSL